MTTQMKTPTPSRFLTYRGDVRDDILGRTLGPNTLGEYLTAVTADYDGEQTRVGFVYAGGEFANSGRRYSVTQTTFGRTVREMTA